MAGNTIRQLRAVRHLIAETPFINGQWHSNVKTGKTFPVVSPYSGEPLTHVQEVNKTDVEDAILSAASAFQAWKASSCRERSKLLRNLYNKVIENQEALATICSLESGKPIKESRAELRYGASFFEWFAEESKRSYGDIFPVAEPNMRRFTIKQPIGVAGLITPWNFPFAMLTRKLGAALAAGCTVVVKPAEDTPLIALALGKLVEEVHFPDGVINILPCSRDMAPVVGEMICASQSVQKVSFTGSTAVGKLLMEKCAQTVKRTSMELGGSAPFIVCNSADVDLAVRAAMIAKFRNNGQACIAADRFFVERDIHDIFVDKFAKAVKNLVSGDPLCDNTDIGTLINKRGLAKVQSHAEDAISRGARVVVGGRQSGNLMYEPTVLTNCNLDMDIMQEETFGPVAPIMKFEEEADVIHLANNTRTGLAGYICSSDSNQQWRVAEQLDLGMVGINEGLIPSEFTAFGGVKESGIGREGSKYGIDDYLETKFLCFGGMKM